MSNPIPPSPFLLPYDAVICRYDEIGTKGANRGYFEGLLVRSLKVHLRGLGELCSYRDRGRIFLFHPERTPFTMSEVAEIQRLAPRIAGIASLSPGFFDDGAPGLAELEALVLKSFGAVYDAHVACQPGEAPIPYRLRVNRAGKAFPMTAQELEIHFAALLVERYPRLKVNLKQPVLDAGLDLRPDRKAFLFYEKFPGPGGLPTASAGRVTALLSGGIDSPVACHEMMMRGCEVDYVTFHSAPYTPPGLVRKVAGIAERLNTFQEEGRFYAVNMLEAQKAFRDACFPELRTVLYRRLMMRVASVIAQSRGSQALVTGENLGQVASQTLQNMSTIGAATRRLVLRPLVAFHKEETSRLAEQIGTRLLSEEMIPDSCTVFLPGSPATTSSAAQLEAEEAKVDLPALLRETVRQVRLVDSATLEEREVPILMPILERMLVEGF